jgi:hypothetical protein
MSIVTVNDIKEGTFYDTPNYQLRSAITAPFIDEGSCDIRKIPQYINLLPQFNKLFIVLIILEVLIAIPYIVNLSIYWHTLSDDVYYNYKTSSIAFFIVIILVLSITIGGYRTYILSKQNEVQQEIKVIRRAKEIKSENQAKNKQFNDIKDLVRSLNQTTVDINTDETNVNKLSMGDLKLLRTQINELTKLEKNIIDKSKQIQAQKLVPLLNEMSTVLSVSPATGCQYETAPALDVLNEAVRITKMKDRTRDRATPINDSKIPMVLTAAAIGTTLLGCIPSGKKKGSVGPLPATGPVSRFGGISGLAPAAPAISADISADISDNAPAVADLSDIPTSYPNDDLNTLLEDNNNFVKSNNFFVDSNKTENDELIQLVNDATNVITTTSDENNTLKNKFNNTPKNARRVERLVTPPQSVKVDGYDVLIFPDMF